MYLTKEQKIGAKRLLKLGDFLDTVPKKKFDMKNWCSGPTEQAPSVGEIRDGCGTTACALGWACTIPSFRRLGLSLSLGLPTMTGLIGFDAAAKLFCLAPDEALFLFGGPVVELPQWLSDPVAIKRMYALPHSATPKQVARQLRKFVKYFRS